MTPEDLQKINDSRTADVLMGSLKPYLDKQRADIVVEIKNMYRSKEYSIERFVAAAAALCVIDDLENKMAAKYRNGLKLSTEEYNDAAGRN